MFFTKGTEFNMAACTITGILRHMEIQCCKEGVKKMQFNSAVGVTAGCTLRSLLGTIPVQDRTKKIALEEMRGVAV
jgi:hypothetical protein